MIKYNFALLVIALGASLFLISPIDAVPVSSGLSDPDKQPKFTTIAPNPLDPSFKYDTSYGVIQISIGEGTSDTGLVGPDGITPLSTKIWGYGTRGTHTWPGKTFEVQSGVTLMVNWRNGIPIENGYLLTGKDNGSFGNFSRRSVVDTSYHWAFSLPGYQNYSIEENGTPIVPHLHGGHNDAAFDGNPEYFFTPQFGVRGPQWHTEIYKYDNSQPASALWYHDHALGITRLNVYAGMAGFYFVRDEQDTGKQDNPMNLPAFPYELAFAIQDRMFKDTGELFYPAFPGDPFYSDFITDEGADINDDDPTALAEFFGDHMVVNGKIWPKVDVEPRHYRLRLLNGCDSRFLVMELFAVDANQTDFVDAEPISFHVIGGDQGLATESKAAEKIVIHPSARFDIIVDFTGLNGKRVIMKNSGGDEPFGGTIPGIQAYEHTDKVLAFDVSLPINTTIPDNYNVDFSAVSKSIENIKVDKVRRVGLFEGRDQFGRLQPLLGTIDPAVDMNGHPILWPTEDQYLQAGVQGQMSGTMTWHAPTTENIRLGDTEEWEIWNLSADAHPVHLHLVRFEVVSRKEIIFESMATDDGEVEPGNAFAGDGTYIYDATLVQHDGSVGEGYKVANPTSGATIDRSTLPEYVDTVPLDSVTALPGQITTIRAKFDKPGRFNWHCHILAHEDHEMMRLFHVGLLPPEQRGGDPIDVSTPPPTTSAGTATHSVVSVLCVSALAVMFLC